METHTIILSKDQLKIVLAALLELPAKFANPVLQVIDKQLNETIKPE